VWCIPPDLAPLVISSARRICRNIQRYREYSNPNLTQPYLTMIGRPVQRSRETDTDIHAFFNLFAWQRVRRPGAWCARLLYQALHNGGQLRYCWTQLGWCRQLLIGWWMLTPVCIAHFLLPRPNAGAGRLSIPTA